MSKQVKKGRRPENMKATLAQLMRYLLKSKWGLAVVAVALVVSSLANIAGTYFIRPLVNDFIDTKDVAGLGRMILMISAIYVFGVVCSFIASKMMVGIGQRTIELMRGELFNHIQKLPIQFFDTHKHGDLMSRFTNDFDNIQNMFNNSVLMIITSSLQLVLTFTMMVLLSPLLTISIVVMLGVIIVTVRFIGGRSARYFGMQQKHIGTLNGFIEEHIEGQKVIKVFHHEDKVLQSFDELNEQVLEASKQAQFYANTMFPVLGSLGYINYALTATLGGFLTINGVMDIGALASFLQYTRTFSMPIGQLSQQVNVLLAALAGAERIFKILEQTEEIDNGTVTLNRVDKDKWYWQTPDGAVEVVGKIILEDVDFGYTPEKQILKGINVWAEPGLKIAFVGATGAGKTTITNLINRFYEIHAGQITFDGIPVTDIKKSDLRQTISIVLQDTHLFTGTIADNIRYGRLDASDDDVIKAAKLANAHSFIKRLPQGYHTQITGDGDGLSQGQRQLLAIARAAVANPKVLILDEATSSIDSHTEAQISKGMDQLMAGRTSFVIAHRLSTIRNADVIMVMDHGEIIERGNHESLMEKNGVYYKLYTGQIELD
ncbi:ABC transporter ATP-binding protein [Carnobacteriaceae bacterium zg-ZUI252]|nr:ABC transporter ATP-binding protein [Carnobacteriaceae bacterium zg-ZUI252]QTU83263.1 ABC transporter ATP-binding protein [Carnobacteriaceae bacterium zg-C25]